MTKKVYVLISGGVDSSVAASDLVDDGYNVVGVFLKCWSRAQVDKIGISQELYACSWEDDLEDAKWVCSKLGIPLQVWDLDDEYRELVVEYMLQSYINGLTPNPDIMCNSRMKFGLAYDLIEKREPSFVATGHYCNVKEISNWNGYVVNSGYLLCRGMDRNKDQSYFLSDINPQILPNLIFPVGKYTSKSELRKKSQQKGLVTADKKDSQGLCFLGDVSLREMLLGKYGKQIGDIVESGTGKILGQHEGSFTYTIGQREKLGLSGGPWFVSHIDVIGNVVYVVHNHNSQALLQNSLKAIKANWFIEVSPDQVLTLQAQIRYRQEVVECEVKIVDKDKFVVDFTSPAKAIAKGQTIALYDKDWLIGSGVISNLTTF
jgi:tRNA-uridine 2-sulfurtransferase